MKETIQGEVSDEEFCGTTKLGNSGNDSSDERNEDTANQKEIKSAVEDSNPSERVDIDPEKESSNGRKESNGEDENNSSKIEDTTLELSRRSSTRLRRNRPRITMIINSSDEENFESSDEETYKTKKRNVRKRTFSRNSQSSDQQNPSSSEGSGEKSSPIASKTSRKANKSVKKPPKEFSSGSYVVLKTDYHSSTNPPIWKIDGKALLQKFVHFDKDGQILYKNTSTYSGWTLSNKDLYYPATVENKLQNRKVTIVKFQKELIVADDSD